MAEQEMTRQKARQETGRAREGEQEKVRVREDQLGQYFWHAERSQGSRGMPFPWHQRLDTHQLSQSTNHSKPIVSHCLKNSWQLTVSDGFEILRSNYHHTGATGLNKIVSPFIVRKISSVLNDLTCRSARFYDNAPLKVTDISGNWSIQ